MRTLGMLAYNPAIGRVLENAGVDRFAELMVQTITQVLLGRVSRHL